MSHAIQLLAAVAAIHPEITWERIMSSMGDTLAVSAMNPMKSAAGHYLGRWCCTIEDGEPDAYLGPYSRETGYYPDEATLCKVYAHEMMPVRDCVENNALYDSGQLPHPGK
jgi:hypothetical protein